jgi:hypothetical protein
MLTVSLLLLLGTIIPRESVHFFGSLASSFLGLPLLILLAVGALIEHSDNQWNSLIAYNAGWASRLNWVA